uniref:Uncharacterized protein TCIL3000_11_13780 n=1 Tax=Trypanosoma congolense (strain IL3000) TaxID=1068625 RepID=G0V2K0_TRYCI|nr:unnamed protein product [Trypanosoma congolense IL3000]
MWTPNSDGTTTTERLRAQRRREVARLYEDTYELRRRDYVHGPLSTMYREQHHATTVHAGKCNENDANHETMELRTQQPSVDAVASTGKRHEHFRVCWTTPSMDTSGEAASSVEPPLCRGVKLLDVSWGRYDTLQPRLQCVGEARRNKRHQRKSCVGADRILSASSFPLGVGSNSLSRDMGGRVTSLRQGPPGRPPRDAKRTERREEERPAAATACQRQGRAGPCSVRPATGAPGRSCRGASSGAIILPRKEYERLQQIISNT